MDFSSNGKYMALAERRDCKDYVSLFDCSNWQLVRHFGVDTSDLAGLSWSPDGKVLCVWDSVLDYKVYLYSMDGRRLATYSAYEHALGVKCVRWSPTSQFLAVGSFDQKLRVLNHITWKTVAEHLHPSCLDLGSVVVYTEVEETKKMVGGGVGQIHRPTSRGKWAAESTTTTTTTPSTGTIFFPSAPQSRYEASHPPITVPSVKPDPEKPNPKLGVGLVAFSPDSRYVATRNDNMPCAVWIWDVANLRLSVLLLQTSPVRELRWDPRQPRLALCTANSRLYLWSPAGCVSVTVPVEASGFTVQRLVWHPDGKSLALVGSTHFCVCYLQDGDES